MSRFQCPRQQKVCKVSSMVSVVAIDQHGKWQLLLLCALLFNLFLKNVCLFISSQRSYARGVGAEREKERAERGERESQAGSTLSAESQMWGSNPRTVRSWPEAKSRVRCLTDWATQASHFVPFLCYMCGIYTSSLRVNGRARDSGLIRLKTAWHVLQNTAL